jgi:hypothetical protein
MHVDPDDDEHAGLTAQGADDRRGKVRQARRFRRSWLMPWLSAIALSLIVLTAGVLAINVFVRPAKSASAADSSLLSIESTRGGDEASRDFTRPTSSPSASPAPLPSTASAVQPPVKVKPVAGLTQLEMDNAVAIIDAAVEMRLPRRAAVVGLTTALQETHLRNLANARVPESLKLPHQGVEANFDSIGLFQQRPSQGWGKPAELMDPKTSAKLFYARLVKVPGWQTMSVGAAAQAVQRSAFPSAYDKHQSKAEAIVAAVL